MIVRKSKTFILFHNYIVTLYDFISSHNTIVQLDKNAFYRDKVIERLFYHIYLRRIQIAMI